MKTPIKFAGIVIGILAFVILTSGCIFIDNTLDSFTNSPTKTIKAYGVSLEYPSSWYAYASNKTGKMIFVDKENGFNIVQFTLQIMSNNGMPEQQAINDIQEGDAYYPGWDKIGSNTITIDNKTAYEDIFIVNDTHYSKLMKISRIVLVKNDSTYLIHLQAPETEYGKERANFNVILNSFKVN